MLFRTPKSAGESLNSPVVAIGNFDGVHRGHATVIERAVREAEARGVDAAVLTFEPHPIMFFRPDTPEFRIASLEQKSAVLHEHGVAGVIAATFDRELSSLSPDAFVEQVLVGALGASAVLVGADFRFGAKRAGDIDALRELSKERFEVLILPQLEADDEVISSTRIRGAIREADFDTAGRLLGRPYTLVGEVVSGDKIGRTFGFPTANLRVNTLLPPDGIYASRLSASGRIFDAATYIGTRPAVQGTERVVEAFCLDVEQLDLYGETAEIEFVVRVREDRDFDSHEALIEQMHADVANVRAVLAD